MSANVTVPSKGEPLRATWAAGVANAVNALGACAPSGMLVRDGAGGQGFQPLPVNKRTRGNSSTADLGCWRLKRTDDDPPTLTLENQYYSIGGKFYKATIGTNLFDSIINQGELGEGEEYTAGDKPFVCLKVYAETIGDHAAGEAEIVGFESWGNAQSAMLNVSDYIRPLYKLTHAGGIAVDFRNMPELTMFEI